MNRIAHLLPIGPEMPITRKRTKLAHVHAGAFEALAGIDWQPSTFDRELYAMALLYLQRARVAEKQRDCE